VLTTRFGGALEPRNFHRSFQARCRAAGVRWVAMQILRHSQIAVTMNVYTETYSEDTVRALQRLAETFDGPAGCA